MTIYEKNLRVLKKLAATRPVFNGAELLGLQACEAEQEYLAPYETIHTGTDPPAERVSDGML